MGVDEIHAGVKVGWGVSVGLGVRVEVGVGVLIGAAGVLQEQRKRTRIMKKLFFIFQLAGKDFFEYSMR